MNVRYKTIKLEENRGKILDINLGNDFFFFLDLIPKAKTKYLEVFPTVPPPPGLRFRP